MLDLSRFFSRIYASRFTGKPFPGEPTRTTEGFEIIEMEKPKPDPDAIGRIARDFGLTPRDALFVGDSIASDIEPALLGGARAALLRRDTASYRDWLPDLLRVSHRRAETRADAALSDAELDQLPTLLNLHQLWDHFLFSRPDDLQ